MTYPVSACVFIRNTYKGAFCLFESMASVLPFVSEFIVMDLGSDDGTRDTLNQIAMSNHKVKLVEGTFHTEDASIFATLANDLIAMCKYDNVLYYQADEIFHQDLLKQLEQRFQLGDYDLSFWRIQFRENFQIIKWFPHLVHRVGQKGHFNFTGDGMNTDRVWDASPCTNYNAGWFSRWGSEFLKSGLPNPNSRKADTPAMIPANEMITDVSLVGGFRDNIVDRRYMHAPFWHEEPHIENKPASQWLEEAKQNPNWTKRESPFDLPHILKGLVGETKYYLRDELLESLKKDDTRWLLGLS